MYDAENDPYCYPGTSVLRNRFDIQNEATLEALETELTSARAEEALPEGSLDASHFMAVHHHLFQDIYDWAGELRTIRIAKQDSHFCYPEYIDNELGKLFTKLAADNYLCDLSPQDFAAKAAAFLATLNIIHAFREGNGRTQLSFLVLIADNAGHAMNLAALDPDAMLQAMIQSFFGNEAPLAQILASIIDG